MKPLEEVRFWDQVLTDSKRLVVCHPEMESRVKTMISARAMDHQFEVQVNPMCPEDRIFLIDENALSAESNRPVRLPAIEDLGDPS